MRVILGKTKTERSIRNVYILSFILILVSYIVTLISNRELLKQSDRVQHTNNVIKSLDNMLAAIKDAETGTRGYINTGDIRFLFPYYGTKEKIDSIYLVVKDLVTDNPRQGERLDRLKGHLSTRMSNLEFSLHSFESNNRQMTDSMRKLRPDALRIMDSIRSGVSIMQREEDRYLNERSQQMKNAFKTIDAITFVSLILAFSLIVFGFFTYMQVSKSRKRAQQEVEDYQQRLTARIEELDDANTELIRMRSQEKFAATGRIARTIAHEVRNPLTNINLASDQLKDEFASKDENSLFLFDMISRNSNRINQLISDLLNSTKFAELNYEKVNVNDIMDETLAEAADRIALSQIEITRDYKANCTVSIDRAKMKIALLNIVINAIEAMEKQEHPKLKLATRAAEKKCELIITDNGPGLDQESLSRLFEPYFSSKPKGNGLGLTNTQNIVLNHNGEITVSSEPGKGTEFIIALDSTG